MSPVSDMQKPRLSVIGLGKLGAPMAAVFASKGFEVVGLDLNAAFVAAINEGRAPVSEPQLQDYIDRAKPRLRATTERALHGDELDAAVRRAVAEGPQ